MFYPGGHVSSTSNGCLYLLTNRHESTLLSSSSTTVVWASVSAHGIKESLWLPTFKRKQLRHELYPSQPHPPLGTSFLPLSRTDTFFCPESRHIYSEPCSAHLNSHHSSCSFPFTFLFSLLHSFAIRCPGIAHWSRIQSPLCAGKHKKYTRATRIYWECIFWFLISIQISESLSSWHTNIVLTWHWQRTNPLKTLFDCDILYLCLVQSISGNMISQIFLEFRFLMTLLTACELSCGLTFGEIFPDYKIYNELPGMFRMNQTLKRWRGIKSRNIYIFFSPFSCLKEW